MAEQFRRTDPRYDRRLDVQIMAAGKVHMAVTKNVSLGGIFVESAQALPLQTSVQITFSVPTQAEAIDVTGEVRWVEKPLQPDQPVGIGIRFQGLRARDVWALNRFFQS